MDDIDWRRMARVYRVGADKAAGMRGEIVKHYVATPAPDGSVAIEWKPSRAMAREVADYLQRNCGIPAIAIPAESEDDAIAQATDHYYGKALTT